MSKLPTSASSLLSPAIAQLMLCIGVGAVMGQVVMALAARHAGSPAGLTTALVFLLAGAASVTLFLSHAHLGRHGSLRALPLKRWLWALSSGLLASVYLFNTLAG